MPEIKEAALQAGWRVLTVLLIGAMLAKWFWLMFAPQSASVLPAISTESADQAAHLFGIAAVSTVTAQAATPDVKLVGVFAPDFAVLELDGKRQLGIAPGKDISPGMKLLEVARDHVVIERGGVRQNIALEGNASAIKSAQAAVVPPAAMVAMPVQTPSVEQIIQPEKAGL